MKNLSQQIFSRFLKENNLYHEYQQKICTPFDKNLLVYMYTLKSFKNNELSKIFFNKNIFNNIFINFLKENNIYDNFIVNLLNSKYNDSFEKLFVKYRAQQYIDSAFQWSRTIEGHDFWYKINMKWLDNVIKILHHEFIIIDENEKEIIIKIIPYDKIKPIPKLVKITKKRK